MCSQRAGIFLITAQLLHALPPLDSCTYTGQHVDINLHEEGKKNNRRITEVIPTFRTTVKTSMMLIMHCISFYPHWSEYGSRVLLPLKRGTEQALLLLTIKRYYL